MDQDAMCHTRPPHESGAAKYGPLNQDGTGSIRGGSSATMPPNTPNEASLMRSLQGTISQLFSLYSERGINKPTVAKKKLALKHCFEQLMRV